MTEKSYTVAGMSCDHCARSVREQVARVPGIDAVDVDLESGRVRVQGEQIRDAAVHAAVAEAGYEVAT